MQRRHLSVELDTSRHSGIYQEIVEGIIDMTTIVNVSIESTTQTLNALANGEHIDSIPTDDPGIFGEMGTSTETIRSVLFSLHADVVQLAGVGAAGDLTARGDASRYHGIYAEIVQGINQAFQNIQEPMDTVIDRLNTLSAGGHIPKDNPYQGYPAKLLDSLDQLRYALKTLQHETDKVAAAGAAGNLNVRGDTRELQGRYLQMQDALNASISAFNSLLGDVKIAASEVSAGAKQVSGASQTLSQTSAEQASAVEQVTASIA